MNAKEAWKFAIENYRRRDWTFEQVCRYMKEYKDSEDTDESEIGTMYNINDVFEL